MAKHTKIDYNELVHKVLTAKTPKAKQLAEAALSIANQKLITQTRDRIRKYNVKYGTNYVLNLKNPDLKSPTLTTMLQGITTKSLKEGTYIPDELKQRYEVNGVQLSKEEYTEMLALQRKANRLRGFEYYKPYFTTKRAYYQYMDIIRKKSTRLGYLEGLVRSLQVFKQNVLNHIDDLMAAEEYADMMDELKDHFDWFNNNLNTYSRLEIAYKFFVNNGYTGEQMARLFFDSDPKRMAFGKGEDTQFILILRKLRKEHPWSTPLANNRLSQLERDYPLSV